MQKNGLINKYDAPVLDPLAGKVLDGIGVKEEELSTVGSLILKYPDEA